MLYSKEIESRCGVCMHGRQINDDEILCSRHGIVAPGYKCRHFKYDATKRIPADSDMSSKLNFSEKDFSLNKD